MCLIGISFEPAERRLLIVANRDEYHARSAVPACWWNEHPHLFAGRDAIAGGTWLGADKAGRFAAVTNIREMAPGNGAKSRGELPVRFLSGHGVSASEFSQNILKDGAEYGGFNLLVFDGNQLWWSSNRHPQPLQVSAGVYALSNDLLDAPWPKVKRLRQVISSSFASGIADQAADEDLRESLLTSMRDSSMPPGELPDTGVGEEIEKFLAPMFIRGDDYGTRCSTLVDSCPSQVGFSEVSYRSDGSVAGRVDQRWAPIYSV